MAPSTLAVIGLGIRTQPLMRTSVPGGKLHGQAVDGQVGPLQGGRRQLRVVFGLISSFRQRWPSLASSLTAPDAELHIVERALLRHPGGGLILLEVAAGQHVGEQAVVLRLGLLHALLHHPSAAAGCSS